MLQYLQALLHPQRAITTFALGIVSYYLSTIVSFILAIFISFLAVATISYIVYKEWSTKTFKTKHQRTDGLETCVITGGTKGIGFEIAKNFVKDGFNLINIAAQEQDLIDAQAEFIRINPSIKIINVVQDLQDSNAAETILDFIESDLRCQDLRICYLVNNAGYCLRGDCLSISMSNQVDMIHLNALNVFKMCHLFGNRFKNEIQSQSSPLKYRIMNVASLGGLLPTPFLASYSATKHFVHSLSLALHEEFKSSPYNGRITVTSLCPGYTDTPALPKAGIDVSNAGIVPGIKDDASHVAAAGYYAMMTEKRWILLGYSNNLVYWIANSILPYSWSLKLLKFVGADAGSNIFDLKVQKGNNLGPNAADALNRSSA